MRIIKYRFKKLTPKVKGERVREFEQSSAPSGDLNIFLIKVFEEELESFFNIRSGDRFRYTIEFQVD